jgi:hypothetical protein
MDTTAFGKYKGWLQIFYIGTGVETKVKKK